MGTRTSFPHTSNVEPGFGRNETVASLGTAYYYSDAFNACSIDHVSHCVSQWSAATRCACANNNYVRESI